MPDEARQQIMGIQRENKCNFDKNQVRKGDYNINDLLAIKHTQFGHGQKLKSKFLRPYKIVRKFSPDCYKIEKVEKN